MEKGRMEVKKVEEEEEKSRWGDMMEKVGSVREEWWFCIRERTCEDVGEGCCKEYSRERQTGDEKKKRGTLLQETNLVARISNNSHPLEEEVDPHSGEGQTSTVNSYISNSSISSNTVENGIYKDSEKEHPEVSTTITTEKYNQLMEMLKRSNVNG
ncbi:Retrovirus-related Pol polyprotein from transposon TNT 1-94 [Sesbania bispinosa]|nr:Retrovirus-related Pol polyprotein from transposon TNT 1-94 [Sesbania bispinosa]